MFLARFLGVDNFGLYIVALSYFSLVSAISDFGVQRYLMREVAKDENKLPSFFSTVIFLRLGILSVVFTIFSLVMILTDPIQDRAILSSIAMLAVLPQAVGLTVDTVFLALRKVNYSAVGAIFANGLMAIIGFALLQMGWSVDGAVAALILGQLAYGILMVGFLVYAKKLFIGKISLTVTKDILKGSLPYGLLGIMGLLYFKIDTVMLSYLKGTYEAGIYGAAYKFLEAIVFIPSIVFAVMFPLFSKMHGEKGDELEKLYYKSLKVMGILSVPVLIGYLFILPIIITYFLPEYSSSILALQILSITIPLMFINSPGTIVLFSTEKLMKSVLVLSLITLLFNIIANFILIPIYGFVGAASTTVASELLSFLVFFILLRVRMFRL